MLRCPTCENEDQFLVTEVVCQVSRISAAQPNPATYNWLEVVKTLAVEEWVELECCGCGEKHSEEALQEEYIRIHGEETTDA